MEIMLPIVNDSIVEETEEFTVTFEVISQSGNIPFFEPTRANVEIIDDDRKATLITYNVTNISIMVCALDQQSVLERTPVIMPCDTLLSFHVLQSLHQLRLGSRCQSTRW